MELMQLEMFVAVVEEGSVRAASERVFRTQPAVSIGVRKLEEDFGATLCERSEDLLNDLKARRLDLVLVSFRPDDRELESAFLLEDELVLITAPTHPFGRRGRVEFRDLNAEPMLRRDVSQ